MGSLEAQKFACLRGNTPMRPATATHHQGRSTTLRNGGSKETTPAAAVGVDECCGCQNLKRRECKF
ncbi:hypothetical protein PR202_ga29498 [Eleusine coracana subsp. coracana]|uniref:Uncharacterized protein n=1 Tax=Eleusine coracana subsp. coracana TaxID=191504 RepID=A0AAV5DLT7_ELECO|nr:hypothetical protein PR202_ga29498 [Eleusine coracana subsp. coracana]